MVGHPHVHNQLLLSEVLNKCHILERGWLLCTGAFFAESQGPGSEPGGTHRAGEQRHLGHRKVESQGTVLQLLVGFKPHKDCLSVFEGCLVGAMKLVMWDW